MIIKSLIVYVNQVLLGFYFRKQYYYYHLVLYNFFCHHLIQKNAESITK